jgi:hypothetical protein
MPVVGDVVVMHNRSVMYHAVSTASAVMHVVQMQGKMLTAGKTHNDNDRHGQHFKKILLVHGLQ